jgi:DNA gyrase/topoisomerase IV subunit A
VIGHTTKDEDEVVMLIPARSLNTMLFFSDKGKVYSEKVYQIPDSTAPPRAFRWSMFCRSIRTKRSQPPWQSVNFSPNNSAC